MAESFVIGLHMHSGMGLTARTINGVLQYIEQHPELSLRDFNFPMEENTTPGQRPPWIGKVDGVLLRVGATPGIVPWVRSGRAPAVNTAADLCKDFVSVFADHRSLGSMAVAHFLDLGFRHFAFVGYRCAAACSKRHEAVADALAPHGLPLAAHETDMYFSGTFQDFSTLEEVDPELVKLIRTAQKPLAVIAGSDVDAVAVCRVAQLLGLAIPEEVAVLGVNDSDAARYATPPVSSIRTANERIGYEATRLLHCLMRGERVPRRNLALPALEVVPRESTIGKRRDKVLDVQQALEYIREKTCEGIRVEDVASYVHMSLRTFELQFNARVGHTVGEEIRRARLARIKTLLETTSLPMSRIASLAGLNNASYLNIFFRRLTGVSPGEHRREHRQTGGTRSA